MRKDMVNNCKVEAALLPQAISASTEGLVIDLVDAYALMICVNVAAATLTTGNKFGLKLEESDDGVAFADVPAEDYLQELPVEGIELDADAKAGRAHKIGYRGVKRYVRLAVVKTGTPADTDMSAVAISKIKEMPVAN